MQQTNEFKGLDKGGCELLMMYEARMKERKHDEYHARMEDMAYEARIECMNNEKECEEGVREIKDEKDKKNKKVMNEYEEEIREIKDKMDKMNKKYKKYKKHKIKYEEGLRGIQELYMEGEMKEHLDERLDELTDMLTDMMPDMMPDMMAGAV